MQVFQVRVNKRGTNDMLVRRWSHEGPWLDNAGGVRVPSVAVRGFEPRGGGPATWGGLGVDGSDKAHGGVLEEGSVTRRKMRRVSDKQAGANDMWWLRGWMVPIRAVAGL